MNNIEKTDILHEVKNPEKIETKSTKIERMAPLEKNADKSRVELECSNLNFILKDEFLKKWLDFNKVFSKLENPIWKIS